MRKFYNLKKQALIRSAVAMFGLAAYAAFGMVQAQAQTTYFVKENGAGAAATAINWSAASGDLQDVINNAVAGDRIFVMTGTYKPNRPANTPTVINTTSRDNAFVLKEGVNIYGGFAGTETTLPERLTIGETILSGDLMGDDIANDISSNKTDNAYHVVIAANLSVGNVFNGFTITGGYAASLTTNNTVNTITTVGRRYGGGLYITTSTNLTISDVISKYNYGLGDGNGGNKTGAGILVENNSNVTFNNCTIANNVSANNGYGAGASTHSSVTVVFNDSKFLNNTSGYAGGAISLGNGTSANTKFINCLFEGNTATTRGGAIDIRGNTPTIDKCIFKNNSSPSGGAIGNFSGRPTIANSVFIGNSTGGNGPAYGGPTTNFGAIFINCTFFGNINTRTAASTGYSAALQIPAAAATTSTYPDNKSYIYNSIFFGNKRGDGSNAADQDIQGIAANINVFNTITQNYATGTNVQRNVDPLFRNTTDENDPFFLRLAETSTGINAGDNNYIAGYTTDLAGLPRIAAIGGVVDLGAYESDPQTLPVNLISFIAKASNNGVQLNWNVTSATNHKQYIVSRSNDGTKFSLVANTIEHSLVDKNVSSGTYYYKLEQEDLDGKINYLDTKVVKVGLAENKLSVYPNPTKGIATITVAAGAYNSYKVVGLQGNAIITGKINEADRTVDINLSSVSAGTYIIKLIGTSGNVSTRVIKL
jgi:predicted outer membrane repeat protein